MPCDRHGGRVTASVTDASHACAVRGRATRSRELPAAGSLLWHQHHQRAAWQHACISLTASCRLRGLKSHGLRFRGAACRRPPGHASLLHTSAARYHRPARRHPVSVQAPRVLQIGPPHRKCVPAPVPRACRASVPTRRHVGGTPYARHPVTSRTRRLNFSQRNYVHMYAVPEHAQVAWLLRRHLPTAVALLLRVASNMLTA